MEQVWSDQLTSEHFRLTEELKEKVNELQLIVQSDFSGIEAVNGGGL